ncbi:MAG: putative PEP-binding protein, partial [Bdellovibrionota bacterium]
NPKLMCFMPEDVQLNRYLKVARTIPSEVTTFRTFDFGPDKLPPEISIEKYGLDTTYLDPLKDRSLELSLKMDEEFREQIRALMRTADAFGTIKVVFPMVLSPEQADRAFQVLKEEEQVLLKRTDGRGIGSEVLSTKKVKIGAMLETVMSAQEVCDIAVKFDFIQVGSRDKVAMCHLKRGGGVIEIFAKLKQLHPEISVNDVFNGLHQNWHPMEPYVLRDVKNTIDGVIMANMLTGRRIPLTFAGRKVEKRRSIAFLLGAASELIRNDLFAIAVSTDKIPRLNHVIGHVKLSECERMARIALNDQPDAWKRNLRLYDILLKFARRRNLTDHTAI